MKKDVVKLIFPVKLKESHSSNAHSEPELPQAIVGVLAGFGECGEPLVNFAENTSSQPVPGRSVPRLTPKDIGCEVVLVFDRGDMLKPVIIGLLSGPETEPASATPLTREAEVDGERLVFTAEKEIVLRCGQASITLTRAGKILIRGAYLLSRSSGVNRIKGGSVQIN